MAASNHQPLLVECTCNPSTNLDYTATRNEAGDTLVLHIVNYGTTTRSLVLNLTGFGETDSIRALSLSGTLNGENTPDKPTRFVPAESTIKPGGRLVVKPNSYNVFVIPQKGSSTRLQALGGSWADDKWYDLSGRQISGPALGGIYIQEGKKIAY